MDAVLAVTIYYVVNGAFVVLLEYINVYNVLADE